MTARIAYFAEGLVCAWSDAGAAARLAGIEIALVAGCVSSEPRAQVRAGGSYSEEIECPLPRQMLIDPTCSVR